MKIGSRLLRYSGNKFTIPDFPMSLLLVFRVDRSLIPVCVI